MTAYWVQIVHFSRSAVEVYVNEVPMYEVPGNGSDLDDNKKLTN